MTAKTKPQGRAWIASTVVEKRPVKASQRRMAAMKAQAAALAERALKVAEKPDLGPLARLPAHQDKDASGEKGVRPSATAGNGVETGR